MRKLLNKRGQISAVLWFGITAGWVLLMGIPARAQGGSSSGAPPAAIPGCCLIGQQPPEGTGSPPTGLSTGSSAESDGSVRESVAEKENADVVRRLRHPHNLQLGTAFFLDSLGNGSVRSFEQLHYELRRGLTTNVQLEERDLWKAPFATGTMFAFSQDLGYRVSHWLVLDAGGGGVRYSGGRLRATAKGQAEVHPLRPLWISGGYTRVPVVPTVEAATLGLLAEGLQARADYVSPQLRIYAVLSRQHYSDSNLSWKKTVEAIRWIGPEWLKLAAGYSHDHYNFRYALSNGYFSPLNYDRHLGVTGLRWRAGEDHFMGEYLVKLGQETIDDVHDRYAWQAAARNRFRFKQWAVEADYIYLHLAQASGAFRAHVPLVQITYNF